MNRNRLLKRTFSIPPSMQAENASGRLDPALPARAAAFRCEQGYRPRPQAPAARSPSKGRTRAWLFCAALLLLAAVFLYAGYQLVAYAVNSQRAKQEETMLRGIIAQEENAATDETSVITPCPTQGPASPAPLAQAAHPTHQPESPPAVLYEFSKALALNPDTIGRLKLGESIDTYVVQRDNTYYLRRSFSDEYSLSGAIFLDITCSIYPRSRALIIHGHNMKDGTAFGKLRRFSSADYLNRYPVIRFSTLYDTGTYLPFAVAYFSVDPKAADYLDIYQANSLSEQTFTEFTKKVRSMAPYRLERWVCWEDNLLILITCTGNDPDRRFALFAVKQEL